MIGLYNVYSYPICRWLAAESNAAEIAAECIKMCGVDDIADAVAMRKDKLFKRYLLKNWLSFSEYPRPCCLWNMQSHCEVGYL